MNSLELNPTTRWGINVLALLAAVVALRLGESIFIPTVIAVLLAALMGPSAVWLHRTLAFPWGLACLAAVSLLVLLTLIIAGGFTLAVTKIIQELPNPNDPATEVSQERLYSNFRRQVDRVSPVPLSAAYFPENPQDSRIYHYVRETLRGQYVTDTLLKLLYFANNWMWHWVLIMFIMLFLLLEGRMLSRRVVEIFGPTEEAQRAAVAALTDMAHQVRTYLLWRTIINIGVAILVGVVYYALTLKQAWTWALLTSVLFYIPYLGPIVAGVPPLLDAFISCPTPWYTLGVFVFYLAVVTLEGYVIVPIVMGRSMELNATTVMLACLFWELVWGMPGLFLAMPLMAAIKAVCYHLPDMRPWANLMSTSQD